ncbi:MAG: LLM class flavin-dependent oxidoreductase [Thermomicrobiales bacterium]|nr:LLM class flavin-dependent oxidoreductase [Thermomicrobiales bacterium]
MFWVEDHTRLPAEEISASDGISNLDEPLEAWTTLAYLAGMTERVRIGTEVTPLTLRHPALLAKSLATLDVLSGGRVVFGAGTGWHKNEFTSLGIPFEKKDERYAKSIEALEVMRALWTQPAATLDGRFYRLTDAVLAPKPVQEDGIPVWFGGFSDQLLDLVVRFGSGWILGTNPDPAFIVERRAVLWQKLDAAGRSRDSVRIAVPLMAHLSADGDRARATLDSYIERGNFGAWLGDFFGESARRFGLVGTVEDARARLQPYLDIGARDFIFDLRPPGVALESAELLAESIVPFLNEQG